MADPVQGDPDFEFACVADQDVAHLRGVTRIVALDSYRSFGQDYYRSAFEASNLVAALPTNGVTTLPKLDELQVDGYRVIRRQGNKPARSERFALTVCTLPGGHLARTTTAYDFLLMANAAARDGVFLTINAGWRSFAFQNKLFLERQDPTARLEKGQAAKPGWSNHQTGFALDIEVGITPPQWRAGKRDTKEFQWLTKNGAAYGFDHKEGSSIDEAFHWTHLADEIVGKSAFSRRTGFAFLTADSAVAAAASNTSTFITTANREAHDKTVGLARANALPGATRAALNAEEATFVATASLDVANTAAQVEKTIVVVAVTPEGYDPSTLDPFVFNFTTGRWGDGKPV